MIQEKQAVYNGIAMRLQTQDPAVYSLFQGDQWTTRLEIGFTALFAAIAAGLLVLLIALTLIILKLGFLLLLVAGPFFLIVGVHPGFGRVVAIRWFEMLVGVLLKQVAVALVLSVLLYCYSLIMSTTDQELPWATQDHDDLARHRGGVHLQEAVPAPVLLGRLRHARRQRAGRDLVARVGLRVPPGVRHGGGHRLARRGRVPRVPVGAPHRGRWHGSRRRDRDRRRRGRRPRHLHGRDVGRADGRQPLRRAAVAGRRGRHRTHGAAAAAADQRRPADRERRFGGLGQGRRRGGWRLARPGAAACPHHRPDARRAHAATPGDAVRAEAIGDAAALGDADGVDAAGTDAVDAGARTAVLVAVPPSAPVAEPAMELSPGKQRLLFVVVVIGLVALGIFVIRGRNDGNAAAPAATPTPTATKSGPATSEATTGASAPASSPAASLAGATPPATAGGANIYQWLPFTQSDLSAAAKTTLAFANVYANTSYTETNAAYAGKLAGLTTTQEAATLENDFETAGIRTTRIDGQAGRHRNPDDRRRSTRSARPRPPASITFDVTIAQQARLDLGHDQQHTGVHHHHCLDGRPAGRSATSSYPR